jgi:hypothetical protein
MIINNDNVLTMLMYLIFNEFNLTMIMYLQYALTYVISYDGESIGLNNQTFDPKQQYSKSLSYNVPESVLL